MAEAWAAESSRLQPIDIVALCLVLPAIASEVVDISYDFLI